MKTAPVQGTHLHTRAGWTSLLAPPGPWTATHVEPLPVHRQCGGQEVLGRRWSGGHGDCVPERDDEQSYMNNCSAGRRSASIRSAPVLSINKVLRDIHSLDGGLATLPLPHPLTTWPTAGRPQCPHRTVSESAATRPRESGHPWSSRFS